jgi:hypothetical protein
MRKLRANKKAAVNVMAVGIVILLLSVGFIGFAAYKAGLFDEWLGEEGTGGTTINPVTGQPVTPVVPSEGIRTGPFKYNIKTVTTQTTTVAADTAYVGVCTADANGYFDALVYTERVEKDADALDTSGEYYSAGDELILAVSSDDDATSCNETYSRWFYIESLDHNADVLALPKRNPISAISGSVGAYTIDASRCEVTGQKVQWYEAGDGSYWHFGTFKLYERLADENTIVQHISAGVVGATYNDGTTFEDADSDINANYTFTGNSQHLYLQLIGEANDGAWGVPTLAVTSTGEIKQYQGVFIFATDAVDMTDIQTILDDGWRILTKPGLTNDIAFYYVVDAFSQGGVPDIGDALSISVPITISDTGLAASTEYEFECWFLDWQNVDDVSRGSTTATVPSGNGVCYEVGADAVSQPVALTLSSNSVATPALMGHFTTNA